MTDQKCPHCGSDNKNKGLKHDWVCGTHHFWQSGSIVVVQSDLCLAITRANKAEALYNDLIMQVARKFDGESRHNTAKRYIIQAETNTTSTPNAAFP